LTDERLPVIVMVGESAFSEGVSICTIYETARLLGVRPLIGFGSGRGVALKRTEAIGNMATALGVDSWRGILMDYDTLVEEKFALKLANDIRRADDLDLNIVGPMHDRERSWNVYNEQGQPLEHLPDSNFFPVYSAGLGFYYGQVISGYSFHEGDNGYGEDQNYFLDNKLKLRVITDVEFWHVKPTPL
jgi:hypothetical protein